MQLTVIAHFGSYKPGDKITDVKLIEAILKSENAARVVRTAAVVKK